MFLLIVIRHNIYRTVHELSILYKSTNEKIIKTTFHSVKIELKDITGEKIIFVSVGITPVVILFRKILDNNF